MFRWVLMPIRAEGISMQPTYRSGSLNLVNRLAFASSKPSRGDVVAIRLAGPHVLYVKRIVALPGERFSMSQGQAYVNGAPLSEPYVQRAAAVGRAGSDLDGTRVLRHRRQSRHARQRP